MRPAPNPFQYLSYPKPPARARAPLSRLRIRLLLIPVQLSTQLNSVRIGMDWIGSVAIVIFIIVPRLLFLLTFVLTYRITIASLYGTE